MKTDVSKDRFDWKYVSLNIQPNQDKKDDWKTVLFAFIARRGESYIPDIAVDDVQLRSERLVSEKHSMHELINAF